MKTLRTFALFAVLISCGFARAQEAPAQAAPSREAVLAVMREATDFMFNTLANRGGFAWFYTMDLEPYGELKARSSMIWVEPPGTPSAGLVLLEAYRATQDDYYLHRAGQVADALAQGQHPSGGWNYFIDFDPEGLPDYYASFFSQCWGWQEYLKQQDNCTFDDYSTTEPARFFLRLFDLTKEDRHQAVLLKALDHVLRAQYPDGGWPQRFPVDEGGGDYTAARTFNDAVIHDCILLLLEAHERLGDEKYRAAAIKGMNFYLRAQLPAPQAGWAQQYDAALKPAWGRPFEIGTVNSVQTIENIDNLFEFYQITGDAKYLAPVSSALDWLDASRIPGAEGFTHTGFYEMETNRPIYIKQTGSTAHDVSFSVTYDEEGCYPYAHRVTIDVDRLRREHARLSAMTPDSARAEYDAGKAKAPLPDDIKGGHLAVALNRNPQTPEGISAIVGGLDERGGWREEVSQLHPFQPFTEPPQKMEAYVVGGYIARMYRLVEYLNAGGR